MNQIIRSEHAGELFGISGRFHNVVANTADGRIVNQEFASQFREVEHQGERTRVKVRVRFDDGCGNGHESLSIVGESDYWHVFPSTGSGRWAEGSSGQIVELIGLAFPELAELMPFHLCSTDGPMHYGANTVFFAGDRDFRGLRAGEGYGHRKFVEFDGWPILHKVSDSFAAFLVERDGSGRFASIAVPHPDKPGETYKFGDKWSFAGFDVEWHHCPFDSHDEAEQFAEALSRGFSIVDVPTAWSEGKDRELDAARRAAIWPEATDAELCAEPEELRAALVARLPGLLARFRSLVERAGFLWTGEGVPADQGARQ